MNAIFCKFDYPYFTQGVSLKIYTGEITAILGHNGAGKFWMERLILCGNGVSKKSFVPVKMIISLCVTSIDCSITIRRSATIWNVILPFVTTHLRNNVCVFQY